MLEIIRITTINIKVLINLEFSIYMNSKRRQVFEDIKYEDIASNYEPPQNESVINVEAFVFVAFSELLPGFKEETNSYSTKYIPERYDDCWPEQTDLACWNCTLNFNCKPWTIPVEKVRERYGNKFYYTTCGIYCSAGCALNDLDERNDKRVVSKVRSREYLHEIYVEVVGDPSISIAKNPSHVWLKRFCGVSGIQGSEYASKYRN
jgi:hypothetical protein